MPCSAARQLAPGRPHDRRRHGGAGGRDQDSREAEPVPAPAQAASWPETRQGRAELGERLSSPPFLPASAEVRRSMRRGSPRCWTGWNSSPARPGKTAGWPAEPRPRGRPGTDLVPSVAVRPAEHVRNDLLTAVRLLLTGQVLRPGYGWLLRYRPSVLLEEARSRIDPAGFARLRVHFGATGRRNPQDLKEALNRITWILLSKGGLVRDITIGDCIELGDALQEHQCQGANNRPLFYALLAETGVLPAGAPPIMRAARMTGQLTPAGLVAKYGLQNESMRELFTSYLAERAAELDYASLVGMANTLCGNFWRDLEQHHPGSPRCDLDTEVAAAWKERLRRVTDRDGRPVGDRANSPQPTADVRAFYSTSPSGLPKTRRGGRSSDAVPDQGQRVLDGQRAQAPQGRHGPADPRAPPGPARAGSHRR